MILSMMIDVGRVLNQAIVRQPPTFMSIAIPQVSSASVSFVAATTMAIMIARTGPRLSTPYRRIIFGLSIADITQSLGFLTGPFAVPRSIPHSWGLGNEATCKSVGFIVSLGLLTVPMYTCFICWYYLNKLKFRMSDVAFAHSRERMIHVIIIAVAVVPALVALTLNLFHTVPSHTYCHLATTPFGCRFFTSEVECDATITFRIDIFWAINISLQLLSVVGVVIMMSMIYWHVIRQNRGFLSRPNRTATTTTTTTTSSHNNNNNNNNNDNNNNTPAQEILHLSSLYRNEIALQATCYVGVFTLTYVPHTIIHIFVITGRIPPNILINLAMTLLPLGGLFNILVYSRPKAACIRRAHPDRSRLHCLWVVLRAGGEIPGTSSSTSHGGGHGHGHGHVQQPQPQQQQQEQHASHHHHRHHHHRRHHYYSSSSINPIGVNGFSNRRDISLSVEALNYIAQQDLARHIIDVEEGRDSTLNNNNNDIGTTHRTVTTVKMDSEMSQLDL